MQLFDCKLDWDYLKQYPTYVEQCKTRDVVAAFARASSQGSSDKLFFRDGGVSRRLNVNNAYDGRNLGALMFRIDQVVDSRQWTGPNKCLGPFAGTAPAVK